MATCTQATSSVVQFANNAVDRSTPQARRIIHDRMPIMGEVRLIGGALVFLLLIVFVLTEIYNAVDVAEGPFESAVDDLETIGSVALGLLVLALLVVAASGIMRFFGTAGFGGRE